MGFYFTASNAQTPKSISIWFCWIEDFSSISWRVELEFVHIFHVNGYRYNMCDIVHCWLAFSFCAVHSNRKLWIWILVLCTLRIANIKHVEYESSIPSTLNEVKCTCIEENCHLKTHLLLDLGFFLWNLERIFFIFAFLSNISFSFTIFVHFLCISFKFPRIFPIFFSKKSPKIALFCLNYYLNFKNFLIFHRFSHLSPLFVILPLILSHFFFK